MFKKTAQRGRSERASSHGVAGMIPTAAIERAHSDRARSGSTGIVTVAPLSFFNILPVSWGRYPGSLCPGGP